jgi:hypothetical protein
MQDGYIVLHWTWSRLGNHFGCTNGTSRWRGSCGSSFVCLEIVLILTQEMYTVCAERTIGTEIILEWYVRGKPSTYLALRLTLSPNGSIRVSTWPTSRKSTIRWGPKWFPSLLYIRCKLCTYVALTLTLSLNRPKRAPLNPRQQWVPSDAPKTISESIAHSTQTVYLSCVKISLQMDQNGLPLDPHRKGYHRVRLKWLLNLWYI